MRSIAIVVGINEYPEFTYQPELHGTVADACDFAEWALDGAGGGVAPEDLYFWTHPWPQPGPGALRDYLDGDLPTWQHEVLGRAAQDQARPPVAREIIYTIERAGREGFEAAIGGPPAPMRALVFLAGHGLRAVPFGGLAEETCFVAADFRPDGSSLAPGLVPSESLRRSLLNHRFDEVVMFLDCCRVQTSKLRMQAVSLADQDGEKVLPWSLALAAQVDKPAYETTADPVRGAFSATLMTGLRSCREGPAHELTAAGMRDYVRQNISTHTDTGQMPHVTFQPDDVGPVIVAGAVADGVPAPAAAPIAPTLIPGPMAVLADLPPGTELVLKDGDGPVDGAGPIIAGPDPVQLPALPPGLYTLEVVGQPEHYQDFRHPGREQVIVR